MNLIKALQNKDVDPSMFQAEDEMIMQLREKVHRRKQKIEQISIHGQKPLWGIE